MRCFECRYLEVLTCYPTKYYCTYDKTTHFADDECKYEHYPIVRCKDCRYRQKVGTSYYCELDEFNVKDADFCSWGERGEECSTQRR